MSIKKKLTGYWNLLADSVITSSMNTVIRNNSGEKIDYTFNDSGSETVVIIGHGVTGNKDRPLVVALAEGLAASGMSVLRFSFSGNGNSEGRFVDSTITKELADLKAVIDAVEAEGKRVIYAGHSMGGAVGVSVAAVDKRIQALISLAGMVNTKKFAETEFGEVAPDEGNMWDDEDCPLSQIFMDDLRGINTLIEKIPNHVSLVPKIESPEGVKNIQEITKILGEKKIIMLDHDDLFSNLIKKNEKPEKFKEYISNLANFCQKNDVIMLRTIGVIFSDEETRITEYSK